MSYDFEKKSFSAALQTVGAAIRPSGHIIVLSGVRIHTGPAGTVQLSATNLDLSITGQLPAVGDSTDLIVNHALLSAFVQKAGGDTVHLEELDGDKLGVVCGAASLELRILTGEMWPTIPAATGEPSTMDVTDLARIVYAASKDASRPVLTGIGFADGWAACSDSYRLAATKFDHGDYQGIIPAQLIRLVNKHAEGPVAFSADEQRVTFHAGPYAFTQRQIAGTFPNWQNIVPVGTPAHTLDVDRQQLLDALDLVRLAAGAGQPVVRVGSDGSGVEFICSGDSGQISELVDGTYDGPTVAYNPTYLSDLANSVTGTRFVLGVTDTSKPSIIRTDETVAAIMPVRTV